MFHVKFLIVRSVFHRKITKIGEQSKINKLKIIMNNNNNYYESDVLW